MRVRVMIKQIARKKPIIGGQELELVQTVTTLQEMIEQIVTINVQQYNNRTVDELWITPLEEHEIAAQVEKGKVGFNVQYSPSKQDLSKALDNASLSFKDGLYKVFINEVEIEKWNQRIHLNEGDEILLLRLVMLAGRMW